MKIEISKQRLIKACEAAIFAHEKNASLHRNQTESHRLGGEIVDHEKHAREYTILANLACAVKRKLESGGDLTEEEFNLIKEYL